MSFESLQPMADTAAKSGRVAVLMGGLSAEREVSLSSGSFVLQALLDAGVDAFKVDVQEKVIQQMQSLEADRAFNILHGCGGEDGQIQAILDALGMPYVGSGVKSSALTMDKLMTKRLFQGCDISTPDFVHIKHRQDCSGIIKALGLPLIIKPVNDGSSIGMTKVERIDALIPAFELASQYGEVMAEQWIDGAEYTVAWLGDTVLPTIRLETPHAFYDYEAKYQADDTRYICPCGLDQQQQKKLDELVKKTIDICDLRHWGRVDLMMDQHNEFQVIEVNTVPGMTDHSLVPMAARVAGLSFQQLVLKLLELTLQPEPQHV